MFKSELENAIKKRIEDAGSEPKLSFVSGITQQRINVLKNGLRYGSVKVGSIKLGTLIKLFPNMQIDFFGTGNQKSYVGKIVQLLNRLPESEQEKIHEAIIACYPKLIDNNLIQKIKEKGT